MRRREFIALSVGGVAAWTLVAHAQFLPDAMRRIGVLAGTADEPEGQIRIAAFRQRLRELGWLEGKNVRIDIRWSGGNADLMRAHAAELVGLKPDVIVGISTPVITALQEQTRTVPIVFLLVADPIGHGFVTDMARPEGNVTGFTSFEMTMGGKWLDLLKEIAPGIARVGLMFDPEVSPRLLSYYRPSIDEASRKLGIAAFDVPVRNAAEIERALGRLARDRNAGVLVLPDITIVHHRELFISSAAKYGLPAVYPFRFFAASGGLVSYGVDTVDLYSRGVSYVDRILRGAKVSDLPVQQPAKYELVINLKAAYELGIDISPTLLARAEEVVE
jgi:putative ABC transport system substrate-binding protein